MSDESPLPPFIVDQLHYLLSHSPPSQGTALNPNPNPNLTVLSLPNLFQVDQIWAGCKNSRYSDHFTLSIPFCLDFIKWDFMCNAQYPLLPPNVVFSGEDEDFNPLLEFANGGDNGGERKSSLRDWNSNDPPKLLALVHEIRDLYLEYHRKRVGKFDDDRLKFETDTIFLRKVVFPVSRGYFSAPSTPRIRLISLPDLKALFAVEDVKLPLWVNGMCMADYLPTFEDNLKGQLVEAVATIGASRYFIEALAPFFGRPVEADSVHFSIPTQFPKLQPVLTMQSCQQCNSQGVTIVSPPKSEYLWSPRWEASEMA